jgi:leucyl aminopeptidase (aminopeptidase T)
MTPAVTEARADLLARRVLLDRLALRPKENVTIEAYPSALPWAAGFVREARRRGARPLLHYEDERSYWRAVEEGRAGLIGAFGEPELAALKETDVYIYFWGPENLSRRWTLPDKVIEKTTAYNRRWYEVARRTGLRGARMGIARVTPQNAKAFGVPYSVWLSEMFAASTRDVKPLVKQATRLRMILERGRTVRLRHPNGTDLRLALAGHSMREGLGRVTPAEMKSRFGMMASVPEALVYLAVDEGTAEGTIVANRLTRMGGTPRRGGRWRFREGRLTEYRYRAGGRTFRTAFEGSDRGHDQPGFLEIGLDADLRESPLMEESERGSVSVGVGGNTGFGGNNPSSFQDWLTVAGGVLSVDGRTIARGGRMV